MTGFYMKCNTGLIWVKVRKNKAENKKKEKKITKNQDDRRKMQDLDSNKNR